MGKDLGLGDGTSLLQVVLCRLLQTGLNLKRIELRLVDYVKGALSSWHFSPEIITLIDLIRTLASASVALNRICSLGCDWLPASLFLFLCI